MDRCKITRMNEGPHPSSYFCKSLQLKIYQMHSQTTPLRMAHSSQPLKCFFLLRKLSYEKFKLQVSFLGSFVSDKIIHKTSCKYC